ncbi:uncharacterized protein LOC101889369 isoform X2 [Musca domestica]|uniref:Uncharacterized protein LOC101889369 n=1 Tax=Musca domestica TaxID=7370 RepID=A0A1I8N8Y3_MUSDO|nr:uncharacterized protein LOC101889369 isoform X2 [Musca domestica]
MFQDSLLIIKSDYMAKRKHLLIYLLQNGFQVQAQRKVKFTPELAAEFYRDISEEPEFMFQVILLSKGPSETLILAKENAVEDLLNSMVCYFGNSVEMEKNVHVTRCLGKVQKDIAFIFPNYIFEPITHPDHMEFSKDNSIVSSLISGVYDIATQPATEPHKNWKEKLTDCLILSNKNLPRVSNQCSWNPSVNVREISQQTKITTLKHNNNAALNDSNFSIDFDTDGISLNITTTSCVSCSDFNSGDDCILQGKSLIYMTKMKTAPLEVRSASTSEIDIGILSSTKEGIEKGLIVDMEEEELNAEIGDTLSADTAQNLSKSDVSQFYASNGHGAGDGSVLVDNISLLVSENMQDTQLKSLNEAETLENGEELSSPKEIINNFAVPSDNVTHNVEVIKYVPEINNDVQLEELANNTTTEPNNIEHDPENRYQDRLEDTETYT